MPRFLIADDHLIVLIGTKHLLDEQFPGADIHLVENFDEALALVQRFHFDIVLLDINLPGGNRLGMIESLRLRQPNIKVLMFSAFDEAQYATLYMKAGADGYISKRAKREEFYKAVISVMQNKKYLSPDMQQFYIDKMSGEEDPFSNTLDKLTDKEREIMNLLVSGLSTNDIAAKLSVSASAISSHKFKIFEKLRIKNILELKDWLTNIER
jgi:two-component system invasion response regulator UvrY